MIRKVPPRPRMGSDPGRLPQPGNGFAPRLSSRMTPRRADGRQPFSRGIFGKQRKTGECHLPVARDSPGAGGQTLKSMRCRQTLKVDGKRCVVSGDPSMMGWGCKTNNGRFSVRGVSSRTTLGVRIGFSPLVPGLRKPTGVNFYRQHRGRSFESRFRGELKGRPDARGGKADAPVK